MLYHSPVWCFSHAYLTYPWSSFINRDIVTRRLERDGGGQTSYTRANNRYIELAPRLLRLSSSVRRVVEALAEKVLPRPARVRRWLGSGISIVLQVKWLRLRPNLRCLVEG